MHPTKGDAKNFHAWKYRLWLVARMQRSPEDELRFAEALLDADRSNFSAWHYRSVLLPRVHAARGHKSMEELTSGAGNGGGVDGSAAGPADPADTSPSPASTPDQATRSPGADRIPLYELKFEFDFVHQVR